MKYSSNTITIISFNEDTTEVLNEALLESVFGILKRIVGLFKRLLGISTKQSNDIKKKVGILSGMKSNKRVRCNISKVGGGSGKVSIPSIDNGIMILGAFSKAIESGDVEVVKRTGVEFINNKINIDYKKRFEDILGGIFHVENVNMYKDEKGDLKLNINRPTIEMTKDEAINAMKVRIPIIDGISSFMNEALGKLVPIQNTLDGALKITKSNSKFDDDLMSNLNKLLGAIGGAVNLVTSVGNSIIKFFSDECNVIYNFFAKDENKTLGESQLEEQGIFNNVAMV